MSRRWLFSLILLALLALSAYLLWPLTQSPKTANTNSHLAGWELLPDQKPDSDGDGFEEVTWEALMPPDFNPDKLFEKYDVNELADDDPQAIEIMKELKATWKTAPVVTSLDGRKLKLPGFIIPLETEGERLTAFFLVPYFGACIHVPPPPANQMVFVLLPEGVNMPNDDFYSPVWVSGQLSIKSTSNEMGDAGYLLTANRVEPYKAE